jgi:hypothetical protein
MIERVFTKMEYKNMWNKFIVNLTYTGNTKSRYAAGIVKKKNNEQRIIFNALPRTVIHDD